MSRYDIKSSDGELWGMWSMPSLSLPPGSLWPRVVAPDRVTYIGQTGIFDIWTMSKQMTDGRLNC